MHGNFGICPEEIKDVVTVAPFVLAAAGVVLSIGKEYVKLACGCVYRCICKLGGRK